MRTYSVHQIKCRLKGRKTKPLQAKPREGSVTRQLFDRFTQAPGRIIEFQSTTRTEDVLLRTLRITYGLDIRVVRQGSTKVHRKSTWILAGEWFGSIYIDYIAETEEQMDLLAEARYALQHVERVENILPEGVHRLSADSIDILQRVAAKGREIEEKHSKRGA